MKREIIDASQLELEEKVVSIKRVTKVDRKSTRLNSSHMPKSRMPSSA